eukprot:2538072-Pyramimonas_sp.AAC.1
MWFCRSRNLHCFSSHRDAALVRSAPSPTLRPPRWAFFRGYEITKTFFDEAPKVMITKTSNATIEQRGKSVWDFLVDR